MDDLVVKIIEGLIRVAMGPVIAWLIHKNIISSDDSVKLVAEIAGYTVAAGWTIWAWIKAHRAQMTALAMPSGSTPNDLKDQIATGNTAPANTPADVAPKIETKQEGK